MSKGYKVAVIGASGLVGRKMVQVLEERNFPISELTLYASERSAGKKVAYEGEEITIQKLDNESFTGKDIALFSAGGSVSKEFAPVCAKAGCIAIDNSSAWRMNDETPLVVPEVNPHDIEKHKGIIANPNCSTIQLMVALKPITDKFGLKRVICSTYQSISGAGQSGLDKLYTELNDEQTEDLPIAFNTLFHPFEENGNTNEENKMINESRKILGIDNLNISVTCVRLPVVGGHAEAVNIQTVKQATLEDIRQALESQEGIILKDDWKNNLYPTPFSVDDKDPVFIGRIRKDDSAENAFNMWVVADNLRKGAATNAVQIAEKVVEMELV